MFVAILPLIGFQTAAAIALAALFRANKAICIPIVWITNPFTVIPIYATCLVIGQKIWPSDDRVDLLAALSKLAPPETWSGFLDAGYWSGLISNLATLGIELWIGILVVGVTSGVMTYFGTRWLVTGYRDRRRHRVLQKTLFRSHVRAA